MVIRDFTLISSDLNHVRKIILDLYSNGSQILTSTAPLHLDIEQPIEYSSKVTHFTLWKPANHASGTILYGNQRDGFSTLGSILSAKYQLSLIRIALTLNFDNNVENLAEFRQFMYYLPNGNCRLVRVMWDGRWQFYEEGERLPFEQTEKYEERIRKKRLTNDMILDYTEALGWDLRDPLCWTSKEDACYITKGVD